MSTDLSVLRAQPSPDAAVITTADGDVMRCLLRCDEMQGYLVSRPVTLDDLTRMLPPEAA